MTSDEMNAVKHSTLGGSVAAKDWNDALNALHKYARASNCPPGADVVKWFAAASEKYRNALTEAVQQGFVR